VVIHWAPFFPAALLISLIPGASQLLALHNGARDGIGYALAGIGGRLTAFAVLIGLVVAGVGAALAAFPVAFTIIKWTRVAYLLWIGTMTMRQTSTTPAIGFGTRETGRQGLRSVVAREFVVAITNAKALLLFAVLLPQFSGPGGSPGRQLALLGAAYLAVELVVGSCYAALGKLLGGIELTPGAQHKIDLAISGCFLGLAGLLAAETT
jgi:threonine/homoserine/homoserine lactone efflux protein